MMILIAVLAFAFAAFCVWLTVRIVNRRERWAKWTAAGLTVALLVAVLVGWERAAAIPQSVVEPRDK
jgi:hypothetical protein